MVWFLLAICAEILTTLRTPHSILSHVLSGCSWNNLAFLVFGVVVNFGFFKHDGCTTIASDHVRVKVNYNLKLLVFDILEFFPTNMFLLFLFWYRTLASKAFYVTKCYFISISLCMQKLLGGVCFEARNVKLMETSFAHEHIYLTALFLLCRKWLPAISACQTLGFKVFVLFFLFKRILLGHRCFMNLLLRWLRHLLLGRWSLYWHRVLLHLLLATINKGIIPRYWDLLFLVLVKVLLNVSSEWV